MERVPFRFYPRLAVASFIVPIVFLYVFMLPGEDGPLPVHNRNAFYAFAVMWALSYIHYFKTVIWKKTSEDVKNPDLRAEALRFYTGKTDPRLNVIFLPLAILTAILFFRLAPVSVRNTQYFRTMAHSSVTTFMPIILLVLYGFIDSKILGNGRSENTRRKIK